MKLDQDHSGSGTFALDAVRDSLAAAAVAALSAGHAYRCVSADHLAAGETCTAVNVATLTSAAVGLAKPKSSSFAPVGVSMMLPGFRSR